MFFTRPARPGVLNRGLLLLMVLSVGVKTQAAWSADEIPTIEQLSKLADPQLVELAGKSPKVTPGFYQETPPEKKRTTFIVMWVREKAIGTERIQSYAASSMKDAKQGADRYLRMSNLSAMAKSINDSSETERYYQFSTKDERNGFFYVRWVRVWKKDFFSPISLAPYVSAQPKPTPLGNMGEKYYTEKGVNDLAQFLWWSQFYNLQGAKVVGKVQAKKDDEKITVTIPYVQIVGGDFGVRDKVMLNLWTLEVFKKERLAWVSVRTIKAAQGTLR